MVGVSGGGRAAKRERVLLLGAAGREYVPVVILEACRDR